MDPVSNLTVKTGSNVDSLNYTYRNELSSVPVSLLFPMLYDEHDLLFTKNAFTNKKSEVIFGVSVFLQVRSLDISLTKL